MIEQSTSRREYAEYHIARQSKESIKVLFKNEADIFGRVETNIERAGGSL